MGYICMECYEVYNAPFGYCPKVTCHGAEVVEIDELMMPIIVKLNQKGYCTDYCCSGHAYLDYSFPYILFNAFMYDIFEIGEFEELCEKLPTPWSIEVDINSNGIKKFCLRCSIDSGTLLERYEKIISANLDLLKFVEELPWLEY